MPFTFTQRVRLEDTSTAGTLYYATVPTYVGRAVEELLAATGHPYRDNLEEDLGLLVVRTESEYSRPMREGDDIRIDVTPSVGESSIRFDAFATRDGEEVFRASETRVSVDMSTMESHPVPESLREGLAEYS
ncbi:acyl-CoA thioesterase [Natrinema caseinilyticum]|uniref:acyl-CoA thioesterase n=1 Tax=Natrinema caseinilyticum TaxID=2961570 RepID=UPI0020C3B3F9|nr:thioesterase family protein [Natrinema caseinilyticum]